MAAPKTRSKSLPAETNGAHQSLLQWPERKVRTGPLSNPYDIILNTVSILLVIVIIVYIFFLFSFNGRATKDVPGIASFLRQFSIVVSPPRYKQVIVEPKLTVYRAQQPCRFCSHLSSAALSKPSLIGDCITGSASACLTSCTDRLLSLTP